MPKNLVFGGVLPKCIAEQLISMVGSPRFELESLSFKIFLFACGNDFVEIEDKNSLLTAIGHISDGRGSVGKQALKKLSHHLRQGFVHALHATRLEGSFSLVLIDKAKNETRIYRNIAGLPPIYYYCKDDLALFSSSLPYLARILSVNGQKLTVNRSQLTCQLLYGCTLWGQTLFEEIHRLLLGEEICFQKGNLSHSQVTRLFDLVSQPTKSKDLDLVMERMFMEYTCSYHGIVNMLSGGVDSSLIQAHLSRLLGCGVKSFSVDLIHPSSVWSIEREYARSASSIFQTDHSFVKVAPSEYPKLLVKATRTAGLPLRNPQEALAYKLFMSLKEVSPTATCGMCAGCLFGLETLNDVDLAYLFDKSIPSSFLKMSLASLSRSLHEKTGFTALKKLSNILELDLHDWSSSKHPLNITDDTCFAGASGQFSDKEVKKVILCRQALMAQLQLEGSLKERLHSCATLNCAQGVVERFYQLASSVGVKLLFPYLDSRVIALALHMGDSRFPYLRTEKAVKDSLAKYAPKHIIYRKKSGWGLPILEWMAPKGVLYPLLKDSEHSYFSRDKLTLPCRPSPFVWNLLIFNVWHQQFFSSLDPLASRFS